VETLVRAARYICGLTRYAGERSDSASGVRVRRSGLVRSMITAHAAGIVRPPYESGQPGSPSGKIGRRGVSGAAGPETEHRLGRLSGLVVWWGDSHTRRADHGRSLEFSVGEQRRLRFLQDECFDGEVQAFGGVGGYEGSPRR